MHNEGDGNEGEYEDVSPEQVREWLAAGDEILLVDVREPAEWQEEHIAGAVLMPVSAFDAGAVLAQAGEERGVVFYCHSGARAERVCQYFTGMTGRAAACMEGSILAWKARGLPTVSGGAAVGL
jgi:adenylyltransferase/sulfurtransferase